MGNKIERRKNNIEDLIKRAKEGESEAARMLIERYKYLIIKEALRYHVPSYEFEDLVQHGYLSVIKAINKYKLGSKSFDGYAINSIKNNYKDLLKGKIKHHREVPDNSLLDIKTPQYDFTLEDQIIAYEAVNKLYEALDKLSKEEREIIERFYINEDSLKEIACDKEISYYKIVRKKEKVLRKLRELMEEQGGGRV